MGMLVYGALSFATQLIVTAPDSIVTVFDFTNCYAAPPIVLPCERVAYQRRRAERRVQPVVRLLLIAVAAWLLWELWNAVAPKPITDDFLKLLDDSFGRDWRSPRTWPWARVVWAYGFTLAGVASAPLHRCCWSPRCCRRRCHDAAKPPSVHVETSQRLRTQ